MSEKKLQLRVFLKLGIVCACAGLYAWAGMEEKWLRRFLAPSLCCLSMFYFSRDWRCLIQLPLMMFTLILGYGADILIIKILRRGIFGLCNGLSGSVYNFLKKNWLLVGIHTVLLTMVFIVVGVWNPFPNARLEETFLGVMVFLIPVFSVKDK